MERTTFYRVKLPDAGQCCSMMVKEYGQTATADALLAFAKEDLT